jgi:hypothetical protein
MVPPWVHTMHNVPTRRQSRDVIQAFLVRGYNSLACPAAPVLLAAAQLLSHLLGFRAFLRPLPEFVSVVDAQAVYGELPTLLAVS